MPSLNLQTEKMKEYGKTNLLLKNLFQKGLKKSPMLEKKVSLKMIKNHIFYFIKRVKPKSKIELTKGSKC